MPPAALAYRDASLERPLDRRSVPSEQALDRTPEPTQERTLDRTPEPPYTYPPTLPGTTSQQPAHARPDAYDEPVPPGPVAAAAPDTGKDHRALVLDQAIAEVARRRDTQQRAQQARNPDGWYRSALTGIERELLEHHAHQHIHAGADHQALADLTAPLDGPLAPVTPIRPGPAPVVDKDRSCFCGGTGWVERISTDLDDEGAIEVTRCPDCNPDPLDAPTPA